MLFRFVRPIRVLVLLGIAALLALAQVAPAQTPPNSAGLEPAKATLDRIEQATQIEGLSDEAFADLKRQLIPVRDDLRDKIDALTPQLAQAATRLSQLGDKPAPGATEDAAITAERVRLTESRADIEAVLKQARLLALRADQVSERINERRRALFARELFTRTAGLFDSVFWLTTLNEAMDELRAIGGLVSEWWDHVRTYGRLAGMVGALAAVLGLLAALLLLRRWWRRRFAVMTVSTRFGRALAALTVLVNRALAAPLLVLVGVSVLDSNGLMPGRLAEIGFGLAAAITIASFGRGVSLGLFAPGEDGRRPIRCSDAEARVFADHLSWGARLLAIAVFFNVMHKGISAPISLTVATSALLALAIGLLAVHLLVRFPRLDGEGESTSVHLHWVRVIVWIFVVLDAIALVTGYIGFAAFLSGRVLVVLALIGALYVVLTLVETLFSEVLTGQTETGRKAASLLGISPRTLELVGTLISALLRVALVLMAFFPVLGRWGIFAADIYGTLQELASGIRIGDINISLTAIVSAIVIFLIGILATRGAQRWLERRFLPRTGLDPGLQNSVSALLGYALLIAVISLTLAQLGLDLQKIALVAGALSVGIGFGLQSIVSNFVSGLILLAERPIRVGDWVVVKTEEGWVRRISVRATEIETFDRATVIVPNSEFITGVVKNWTHSNTMGRTVIKVGVAYDSDAEKVRDILMDCARAHPQVLQTPPPRVFLTGFGDNALDFELRCIVANVENMMMVKSDLHFAVLARFREAGIEIPFPQREVRVVASAEVAEKSEKSRGGPA